MYFISLERGGRKALRRKSRWTELAGKWGNLQRAMHLYLFSDVYFPSDGSNKLIGRWKNHENNFDLPTPIICYESSVLQRGLLEKFNQTPDVKFECYSMSRKNFIAPAMADPIESIYFVSPINNIGYDLKRGQSLGKLFGISCQGG